MAFDVDSALRHTVDSGASDLHMKVGAQPMVRIHGELKAIEGSEPLKPADTETALDRLIGSNPVRAEFEEEGEADLSYSIPNVSRFRVNAFRQRGSISIVCRVIPFQVRSVEDLGLPPVITKLAEERRGIILLTGTTGSGKSTTLAAMIDHINSTRAEHIITLEDPIEYLHKDKRSIINQREIGSDTQSFARAMRRVLRQDPDVILVGEMRDEETVRTALSAAETGHLVLSTLHTLDATETINRIIDFFPPHLQQQARVMLASTLRGAVSQRLVPTVDGHGRVAAAEILIVTGRVQDLIMNPTETGKIGSVIAEGEYYGMQTFDQSLLKQVMAGKVIEKTAMDYATSPHDFKLMLASSGQRASDISQLMGLGGDEGEKDAATPAGAPPATPPQRPASPPASPLQRGPGASPTPAASPRRPAAPPQGTPPAAPAQAPPAAPPAQNPPQRAPAPPPAPAQPAPPPAQPVGSSPPPRPPQTPGDGASEPPARSPASSVPDSYFSS